MNGVACAADKNRNDNDDTYVDDKPWHQTSPLRQRVEFLGVENIDAIVIVVFAIIVFIIFAKIFIITSKLSKETNLRDKLMPPSSEDCWRPMLNPESKKK